MNATHEQAKSIFLSAAEIAGSEEQRAFLDAQCGGDEALRREVEQLLDHHRRLGNFLDSPPVSDETRCGDAPAREQAGTVIGPYKLLEQIGEGGMGVVFMAEQSEPVARRVALKVIKPGMDSRQVIARFEAERQALAVMDHPNIAKVIDAGTTESGRPYFVMELVKGIPITQYCDQHTLSVRERLELFVPICQAIQHAHQKGIIHRDIKPSNVLVARYDERPVPKIIDFGVAKATQQKLTEKTVFTQFGQIVGTFEYMSPEQAQLNQLDIDTRSDVYSLGVLLYELLAGSTPFEQERLREAAFDEVLRIIRDEEPPRPSTRLSTSEELPSIAANRHTEPARLGKDLRGELDWIVMKCLEKDRSRRYETTNGLAMDLQRYLHEEAVTACPPSPAYRFRKFARRNKVALATASIVAASLLLGTAISVWQAIRATIAEREASDNLIEANAQRERAESEAHAAEMARRREHEQHQRADENFRRARQAVDDYFTAISSEQLLDEAGMKPLRKELLEAALRFYLGFAEQQADDPVILGELAATYIRICQIYAATGSHKWVNAYDRSLDIVEQLDRVNADPNTWAAHLTGLFNYNDEYPYLNDPSQELQVFERGTHLYGKLVKSYPDVVAFKESLATAYTVIGHIVSGIGQHDKAWDNLKQATPIWERLMRDYPAQPLYGRLFTDGAVQSYYNFPRNHPEIERICRDAIAIRRELHGENADVAALYRILAMTIKSPDRLDEVEASLRESLRLYEQEIERRRKTPRSVPTLRWAQGRAYTELAELYLNKGRHTVAEEPARKACEILQELVVQEPSNGLYLSAYLAALQKNGDCLRGSGRPNEAEVIQREALAQCEQLVAELPDDYQHRFTLVQAHEWLGDTLMAAGRSAEAKAEYRQALDVARTAAAKFPDNLQARAFVADRARILARTLTGDNDFKEGIEAFREAAAIHEQLMAEQPGEPTYQVLLALTLVELAGTLNRSGRVQEAEDSNRRLASLLTKQMEPEPDNYDYYQERGYAHLYLHNFDAALADCSKSVALAPENGEQWLRRGIVYARMGKPDEALADMTKGLELAKPSNAGWPWFERASLLLRLGRNSESAEDIAAIVNRNPNHAQRQYYLALAALCAGDSAKYRAACAALLAEAESLKADLRFFRAIWPAVLAPDAVDDLNELVRLSETAEVGELERHAHLTVCGAAHLRAGQTESALELLLNAQRAWDEAQHKPEMFSPAYTGFFLAIAYQQSGQHDEAREWFDKAKELADAELKGTRYDELPIFWNRQVTLELLCSEAAALLESKE